MADPEAIWEKEQAAPGRESRISAIEALFDFEDQRPPSATHRTATDDNYTSSIDELMAFAAPIPTMPGELRVGLSHDPDDPDDLDDLDEEPRQSEELEDGEEVTSEHSPNVATETFDAKKTTEFNGAGLREELEAWRKAASEKSPPGADDGQIIGNRYRIAESLGSGGMAHIHKVRHLNLGKEFALKIIHAEMSSDPQMRKAFIREAQLASMMDHPNIVQITDFGVDSAHGAYIVMEYLKGETLHQRMIRDGRLRLPMALDIALQVAEALHYMHQQNVIHCDIKPENIFLCPVQQPRKRFQVKLIDFGLSKREAMGAQLAQEEVGGTPEYMAPEQIRGVAPQGTMDVYSLGMLLYHMIVGEPAFRGEMAEVISKVLHDSPRPPSRRVPEELPDRVDELILKSLAKEPKQRQSSMGQLIFEIRTLMDMLGLEINQRRRWAHKRTPARGSQSLDPALKEMAQGFFGSPCPMFRCDTEPRILVANKAFHRFVGQKEKITDLVGKPLDRTRLGYIWPEMRKDILNAAVNTRAVQQVLSFSRRAEKPVSVLVWLEPEMEAGTVTFTGIILPTALSSLVPRPR